MSGEPFIDIDQDPTAVDSKLIQSVPVIDIGRLVYEDDEQAIAQIGDACRDWGFFQIVNHGVASELIGEAVFQTQSFFARSSSEKQQVMRTRDNPWGYYNNELTKNQRDKKEIFDFTVDGVDAVSGAHNRWPRDDDRFKQIMFDYMNAGTTLAMRLLDALGLGLGLEPGALQRYFSPQHSSFTRLNYFPAEDPLALQAAESAKENADLGIHHHSDAGALTVLLQHQVAGLQMHKNRMWHTIPPLDGAFVVNTGDMMQVWSNDIYQAPVHRVLAMQERDRISIPLFLNPTAEAVIEPLATGSEVAKYSPISWAEYRGRRADGDYGDYGTEVQIDQYRR